MIQALAKVKRNKGCATRQNPSGYDTSITLTSDGASSTTWTVTAGASKVNLSTSTGSTTTVTSSGSSFSSSVGDISIKATAGGVDSPLFNITTRKPYQMVPDGYSTGCDSSQVYLSKVIYIIEDQLGSILPANVPQNEAWTSGVINDYSGANWPRGSATGSVVGPVDWFDLIGAYTGTGATPAANCTGSSTAVQHWGQEWRFGSATSGSGLSVQTDTLQKYINSATHTGITSPD